ncbi:hypothetical protein Nmel_014965 [Mimus melanotis]
MAALGDASEAGAGSGSEPPSSGDLRSVLITSVLNLEQLEVDLFRCAWTPGQRDRAASSSAATLTAAAFSPQGPAPLGARHAAPLRRADRGAGAGGGSPCREPRRAGALAALLLRADRGPQGAGAVRSGADSYREEFLCSLREGHPAWTADLHLPGLLPALPGKPIAAPVHHADRATPRGAADTGGAHPEVPAES